MSQRFAAEQCPHCKGEKREPDLTFTMACTFCKGEGLVSPFKKASYFLEHPDEAKRTS